MNTQEQFKITIATTLLGGLGSIVVGFLFFQANIFNPRMVLFQFVMYGFMIALYFCSLRLLPMGKSSLVLLTFFILQICSFRSFTPFLLLRELLFILILGSVTFVYQRYFEAGKNHWFLRPFLLAALMVSGHIVLFILAFLGPILSLAPSMPMEVLFRSATLGYLIGLGAGFGIELSSFLLKRSKLE